MITLVQVLAVIGRQRAHLATLRKPGATMSEEEVRWAFLVTVDEMASLVDEVMLGDVVPGMTAEHAQHIKEGRAMLFLEGTPVLPELMVQPGGLDG